MAFKLADAFVEIKGDKGKFSGTIRSAKRETSGFATSATKSLKQVSIGLAAVGVAAGIAAVAIGVKLTQAVIRVGRAVTSTAVRFDKLSYLDVISRDLRVMDASAVTLMRENNIPIIVFSISQKGSFGKILQGKGISTIIGA